MFSARQLLLTLPEVVGRYGGGAAAAGGGGGLFTSAPADPSNDLPTQLAKVGRRELSRGWWEEAVLVPCGCGRGRGCGLGCGCCGLDRRGMGGTRCV